MIDLDAIPEPVDAPEDEPADLASPARRLVDPRTLPARFHHLRAAGLCGAHAMLSFQGDAGDSLARRLGSGVHAMLFDKPLAIWDQPSKASVDRRAKVMKEIRAGASKPLPPLTTAPRSGDGWKGFVAKHQGKVILTEGEVASAHLMVDAIKAHPTAARLLFQPGVIHERSIIWAQNGRARQSTPDARGTSHLVELKTTRCAAPFRFLRDAERMAYHAQLADQRAAIAYENGGRPPREVFIVAVENVAPHVVQVYELKPSALEEGSRLCSMWLEKLQMYEMTNLWGGYSPSIEPWEIVERVEVIPDPEWASGESDNQERTP